MYAEWEQSCIDGSAIHLAAENHVINKSILEGFDPLDDFIPYSPRVTPEPINEKVRVYSNELTKYIDKLLVKFKLEQPEIITWDEELELCGTADLLMSDKETKQYCVFDHKSNRLPPFKNANNYGKWAFPPFEYIKDTSYEHYVIQLNLYEFLLRRQGVIPSSQLHVPKALLWVSKDGVRPIIVPDKQELILEMVTYWRNHVKKKSMILK